jgi:hypothetical protein
LILCVSSRCLSSSPAMTICLCGYFACNALATDRRFRESKAATVATQGLRERDGRGVTFRFTH